MTCKHCRDSGWWYTWYTPAPNDQTLPTFYAEADRPMGSYRAALPCDCAAGGIINARLNDNRPRTEYDRVTRKYKPMGYIRRRTAFIDHWRSRYAAAKEAAA